MRVDLRAMLALPLVFAGLVSAQTTRSGSFDRPGSIRGYIVLPNGSPVTDAVKVTLKVLRGDQTVTYTDQQGRFEINNLNPGQYTIEADPDRLPRFQAVTESVQVPRGAPILVTIYLKDKPGEARSAKDKSISVAMLEQKVPSAAKKEFDNASHLSEQGRTAEAIAALRKAIAIYPDYLMAHNDLGAQLLEAGELDEAVVQLRAALKIDPKAFNPLLNLSMALFRQNKFEESLAEVDQALSIEPSAPAAHFYAGLASLKLKNIERAERELQTTYDLGGISYSLALFHLGQIYMKRGEREKALDAFTLYLQQSPNAPNAVETERLIAKLRNQ